MDVTTQPSPPPKKKHLPRENQKEENNQQAATRHSADWKVLGRDSKRALPCTTAAGSSLISERSRAVAFSSGRVPPGNGIFKSLTSSVTNEAHVVLAGR